MFDLIAKYAVAELSKLWDSLKDTWQNVKDPIKDFLSDYFGYDKEKPFWKNISAGFDFCWNATKESIKQYRSPYLTTYKINLRKEELLCKLKISIMYLFY